MNNKIKLLHNLKYSVCVSVDDISEINSIINVYNQISELKKGIEFVIDKKIIELKEKEKLKNESKC